MPWVARSLRTKQSYWAHQIGSLRGNNGRVGVGGGGENFSTGQECFKWNIRLHDRFQCFWDSLALSYLRRVLTSLVYSHSATILLIYYIDSPSAFPILTVPSLRSGYRSTANPYITQSNFSFPFLHSYLLTPFEPELTWVDALNSSTERVHRNPTFFPRWILLLLVKWFLRRGQHLLGPCQKCNESEALDVGPTIRVLASLPGDS